MERTIKFRGKKTDNGEWIYGMPTYDFMYVFNGEQLDSVDNYRVDAETIGQFTGLKDKNGVEIYEGDVLYDRYDDVLEDNCYVEVYYEVIFKEGSFGALAGATFYNFAYDPITTEVVVGNIHDNPEILKDK